MPGGAGMPQRRNSSPAVLTRVRSLLGQTPASNRRRHQRPLPNRPRRRQRPSRRQPRSREACYIGSGTGTRAERQADGGGNRADNRLRRQ